MESFWRSHSIIFIGRNFTYSIFLWWVFIVWKNVKWRVFIQSGRAGERLPLWVLLDNTDEVPHPIMSAIEQIIVQFISHGQNNHLLPLHNAEWPVKRQSKPRNDIIKLNHVYEKKQATATSAAPSSTVSNPQIPRFINSLSPFALRQSHHHATAASF